MRRVQVIVILLFLTWIQWAESRLDGLTLATGVWDITLSTHQTEFLFPPTSSPQNLSHCPRWFPKKRHRVDCTLLLFSNGTFTIHPPSAPIEQDLSDSSTRSKNNANDHLDTCNNHRETTAPVLHMNGRWQWKQSPYCATDRFYDTVQLESYARSAVEHLSGIKSNCTNVNTGRVLQRGSFILHSRLYGHFARSRSRGRPRPPARMVRGVCLWRPLALDIDESNSPRETNTRDESGQQQKQSPQDGAMGIRSVMDQAYQKASTAWKGWARHQKPVVATFVARKRRITPTSV